MRRSMRCQRKYRRQNDKLLDFEISSLLMSYFAKKKIERGTEEMKEGP
jgi:hypothetical protein